jgi:hypothetical protein
MRVLAAVAVSVCVTAAGAAASVAPSTPEPLSWAPPSLSDPVTIAVTNANRRLFLDDRRDYRLTIVEPLERELWIEGGRNVVVVGGHVRIDQRGGSSAYQDNTAVKIRFGDPVGVVHVEGLLIDGPSVADGLAIATGRDVQIQNVRVERAYDGVKDEHADCLQVQRGVGQLRIDGFTCTTHRQGIFLGDHDGPIERADLRRVNMAAAGGKHLFFQANAVYPVALHGVWLDTAPGFSPWAPFGFWVYPQKDGRTYSGVVDRRRRAVVSRDGKRLWFVGSQISGAIRKGNPPAGDFVPASTVGMGYVSPGYVLPDDAPR